MPKRAKFTVVSLFSGCGGLDLGFQANGFEVVYACDNDPLAVECYRRNVGAHAFLRDVTSCAFHSDISQLGKCDVVLGGFPCQGFSKAGPKIAEDPRNLLYLEMMRAVKQLGPAIFIAENVDGLRQNFKGSYVSRISQDFTALGYDVEYQVLDAIGYGVPQHRRRIIFVGVQRGLSEKFHWPKPTHSFSSRNGESSLSHSLNLPLWDGPLPSASLLPARSIQSAIGDLLDLDNRISDHVIVKNWPRKYEHIFRAIHEGQKLCNVRHAPTSVYTWDIPEVFGSTTKRERQILTTISKHRRHKKYGAIPNGNPLSTETIAELSGLELVNPDIDSLVSKGFLVERKGRYDLCGAMFCSGLFKRPLWNAPSPTVLTVFDNPRYFIHPKRNRPFSVRECARLQTFPDEYDFGSSTNVNIIRGAYRLVGNAVPPLLAAQLAKSAYVVCKTSCVAQYAVA